MAENHHLARVRPPALVAFVVLAAVIAGYYWKLTLTDQYTWLGGDDTVSQVLPWLQFQAGEWHKGRFPLWDPSHWAGQPLPGQAQPGAMYPPNWILFSLPLRDGWIKEAWLNGYFVLIHIAAAWFAYLLARTAGAARGGSILAGVVFSLSGWMGQTEWLQMLNSALWAPLVALFLLKWLNGDGWRHPAFAGFFLGVAWLGGHHQIPIFITVACVVFWAWALWRNWRDWPAFVLFWALAGATGAAQILPAYEYGKLAIRWAGAPAPVGWKDTIPYGVHTRYSMSPAGLLGLVVPYAFTHANPFLGFVPLGLAALGIIWNWRRLAVRCLTMLFLLGLCLALVQHTPLHGLFYALVPMVEKARNPSTASFLCGVAAAPLAALGLSGLALNAGSVWARRFMLAGLCFGLLLYATRLTMIQFMGYPGVGEQRELTIAFSALACAALLAAFRARQIGVFALEAALIFLALTEYNTHAGVFLPNTKMEPERVAKLRAMSAHGDIAEFLRKQPGLFRVDVDESAISYNFGDWHGLQQSGGYLASITQKTYEKGLHNPEVRDLLGVAYRVAAEPDAQFSQPVFTSASGLKVWRNPGARGRVFAEHGGACGGEGVADAVAYHPGFVRVAAQLSCAGRVVFTENYYPGWEVTVDGKPGRVVEAHGFLLAVDVTEGAHWIEFEYRPASVYMGGALGVVALAAVLWLGLSGGRGIPGKQ